MGRRSESYRLEKRDKFWYYKLSSMACFISTTEKSRTKAVEWVENFRALRGEGHYDTFADYASRYFGDNCPWWTRENARRKPGIEGVNGRPILVSTRNTYYSHLHGHILPRFGQVRPEDMRPVDWYSWLYDLQYASQTKKHIRRAAIIVLEDMRRDGLITFDPKRDIPAPVVTHKTKSPPKPEDARLLFPENFDEFRALWGEKGWKTGVMLALAFSTGLRTEELRALDIRAVDWDRPGLQVIEAVNRDGVIGVVKSDSYRVVLIPRRMLPFLQKVKGEREDGLLFPGQMGIMGPQSPGHCLTRVIKDMKKVGILPADKHFTPHGLRHAYNSIMKMILKSAGQDGNWDQDKMRFQIEKYTDNILRAFTGHRTEKMTEHYNHPDLEEAMDFYEKNFRDYIEKVWTIG